MVTMMRKIIFLFVAMFFLAGSDAVRSAAGSLYDLPVTLVDQDGQKVGLDVFKGSPVVTSLFYSSCNYSCPILIDSLKKMEAGLPAAVRARTRFLLISFDPAHDTPAVLKKLAADHRLDLTRWKLVSPPSDRVRDIAALLDTSYRALPGGGFNHTSGLTLVDHAGAIVIQEEGPAQAAPSIAARLAKGL